MYTGFWIQNNYIYGPTDSGKFWVQDGYIWGPRNSGKYWVQDGYIWGPRESGKFWIDDGHIYGPHKDVPWAQDPISVGRPWMEERKDRAWWAGPLATEDSGSARPA